MYWHCQKVKIKNYSSGKADRTANKITTNWAATWDTTKGIKLLLKQATGVTQTVTVVWLWRISIMVFSCFIDFCALLSFCWVAKYPHPLHYKTCKASEILRAENQIAANKVLQARTTSHKKLYTKCGHLPKWAWGNMWECIAPERPYGSHKETRQCQIIYTLLNSNS